ncbi:hypothetical protein [Spiroplasma tabanidicola]|uniref:Uncharacterized protein n=1 Tax=Spiroplasma tabanidicola TaxID=324079 RepID=A0A6I6C5N5_9MOLU|nr:hypothetical protein [Spiroplasma tabanidicola]QGS52167.1 hypothetical protein STABA_v1c08110 [Spiroplasma tabanidicola]
MKEFLKEVNHEVTKKNQFSEVNGVKFMWEFVGFPEIININNLITSIETKLKLTFNKVEYDDIFYKINEIRDIFKSQTCLLKTNNLDEYKNIYTQFLASFYQNIRDFINIAFFNYIFFNYIHGDIFFENNYYDNDKFYKWKFLDFKRSILVAKKDLLLSINKKTKEYDYIISEVKDQIKQIDVLINNAKNKAFI